MWIFTRYGFFSIVCLRAPDGSPDVVKILVRARSESHLQKLQARFPVIAGSEILATPEGDYPFRLILSKKDWIAAACEMASEVEWTNFRNEAAAYQGLEGKPYFEAIHDVWDRMAHM